MARPITWRTIAGPNFNNSALGQSIDAFRSAGAGFSDLTDSLFKTQDRVDQGYTNEAIRRSLATGEVDPSLNPRADSAAVYEALLGKRKADTEEDTARSDLRTAVVTRNNLRADTNYRQEQTEDLSYKNSPEYRSLQERATTAAITADEASTSYNTWRQNFEKDESERTKLARDQRQDLENKLIEIRQGAYQEYLSQNVPQGQAPTLEQEREARLYAQSAAQDPAARQILEQYRFEKGYLDEAWDASTWGERDALARTAEANLAEKRAERDEVRFENQQRQETSEAAGYLGHTVIDRNTGQRVPYDDSMKDVERMSSYTEAVGKLRTQGINVNNLDGKKSSDIEHQVIEAARQVLPNASLLATAIEPYIRKGEFDAKGFRDNVLNKVGTLTIQDRINRSRADAGLQPVDFGSSAGSDGATAADILGSAEPAVKSALGGIALNLIPSSIRPEAQKFLSEDTQARASLALELGKASTSSPIDKANMFVNLLRAYLSKNGESDSDNKQ